MLPGVGACTGSRTWNVVPTPCWLSRLIVPPCRSTTSDQHSDPSAQFQGVLRLYRERRTGYVDEASTLKW